MLAAWRIGQQDMARRRRPPKRAKPKAADTNAPDVTQNELQSVVDDLSAESLTVTTGDVRGAYLTVWHEDKTRITFGKPYFQYYRAKIIAKVRELFHG
jgi:hypothetical protein